MILENFGVQEMNAKQTEIINGGNDSEAYGIWEVIKEVNAGWDDFWCAVENGYDQYQCEH